MWPTSLHSLTESQTRRTFISCRKSQRANTKSAQIVPSHPRRHIALSAFGCKTMLCVFLVSPSSSSGWVWFSLQHTVQSVFEHRAISFPCNHQRRCAGGVAVVTACCCCCRCRCCCYCRCRRRRRRRRRRPWNPSVDIHDRSYLYAQRSSPFCCSHTLSEMI